MGLSYEQAEVLGLAHEHPDHPSRKGAAPAAVKARVPTVNELGQNKTEAAWDRKLADLKTAGHIRDYGFETMKFRLAHRTWFTPDFPIVLPDWTLIVTEVKGAYIRPDGMLKLKVAAEQLPFPFFLCVYAERKWTITRLPSRNCREVHVDIYDVL